MKQKSSQKLILLLVLFGGIVNFSSCRKISDVASKPQDEIVKKFFTVPEDASDALKGVIADIKKQEDKNHFVSRLAIKYGFPSWNKSISNTSIHNTNTRNATGDSTQLFLIPFRNADSSVSSYLACARNGNEYTYRYYKKDLLSTLYADSDTTETLREGLLSIFGYFEKRLNNKDSIYIGGIYSKKIQNVSISINGTPVTGRNTIDGSISFIVVCYTIVTELHPFRSQNLNEDPPCITYAVYGTMNDLGFTSSNGYSSPGGGTAGSGTSSFPDGFQCPQTEWWCESGEYRFVNGVLYTPYAYPGMEYSLPWLWWESGASSIGSNTHLSNVTSIINTIDATNSQANWLAFHPIEANDIYEWVQIYLNQDPINGNTFPSLPSDAIIRSVRISIDAASNNLTSGPFDAAFFNLIVASNIPTLQNNSQVISPFFYFFSMECASLKAAHPDWSNFKIGLYAMGNTILEIVQTGLDIAGLVPGVGEFADLTNGFIYTMQGDGVNASLSFSAMIPFAGWGATTAKYAKKIIPALDGSSRTLKWMKRTDGIIEFGDRGLLRKVLGLTKGDSRWAHHLIPWERGSHELVQKAANGSNAFNLNEILNGIPLNSLQHTPPHNVYNDKILMKLNNLWSQNGGANMSTQTAESLVRNLADQIRNWIMSHPSTSINDIVL